jgi:hypothetical protein
MLDLLVLIIRSFLMPAASPTPKLPPSIPPPQPG